MLSLSRLSIIHFVDNSNFASLFAVELENYLGINDKIAASVSNICLPSQWRGGPGTPPPPLFLDQTEARVFFTLLSSFEQLFLKFIQNMVAVNKNGNKFIISIALYGASYTHRSGALYIDC